jgi:hypothetical protein
LPAGGDIDRRVDRVMKEYLLDLTVTALSPRK